MSPYAVTLEEFAGYFATSPERIAILRGFLGFRHRLHSVGIVSGFQWLDGSFVERSDTAQPRDIDVVTFIIRPPGWTAAMINALVASHPEVFDGARVKAELKCDVYWVDLSVPDPTFIVRQTRYWFGLFSHRRKTFQWKGMVEVPLAPVQGEKGYQK